jgi:hypothetical protein
MKRTTLILITVLVLAAGSFLYFTNDKVKEATNKFISKNILGNGQKTDTVALAQIAGPTWVYELVDATDIDDKQFAIPRIDTSHISRVIDWQYYNGGGKYSLTFIDNYSKDNAVKYFPVPVPQTRTSAPVRKEGEVSYEHYNRQKTYKNYLAKFMADSARATQDFLARKRQFLAECSRFLSDTVYILNSPTHRRTDAAGSLDACFNSMGIDSSAITKLLVAFSDLEDNVGKKLVPKPDDISVIVVNPVPGSTKKILGKVPEVQVPEEVLERIKTLTQN